MPPKGNHEYEVLATSSFWPWQMRAGDQSSPWLPIHPINSVRWDEFIRAELAIGGASEAVILKQNSDVVEISTPDLLVSSLAH